MQAHMHPASSPSRWWFVLIVGVICLWVLSLPVFPSQDGPMHRYYAHALNAVLAHQPHFDVYTLRHPFPPYATQYLSLIGLFHFFSFSSAEKLFTVIEILCFACGLRLCATAVGPAGAWVSLLVAPLLLPWYLLMGFFNYSIGLGIALLAVGCWLRLERSRGALIGFVLCAFVLIFTHPVPVILLLAFQVFDLVRRRFLLSLSREGWWKQHARLIAAFVYTLCLAVYPSLAIDTTQTASTLNDVRFHLAFVRTVTLLTGLSPYNSRSHNPSINGYRLVCYAMLLLTLFWAFQAFCNFLQSRRLDTGAAFFTYAAVFTVLLPFLPDHLNGGVFFATRMVILIWVFALLGAAGRPNTGKAFHRTCVALGLVFMVATLVPAELKLRPFATSVHEVESQSLPANANTIFLVGPMLTSTVRAKGDLAFNPYLWASILPAVRQNDLVLDAPWLQLSISPLRAAPGASIIADASALTEQPQTSSPALLKQLFPIAQAESVIRNSQVIMYAGTEHELSKGLAEYLGTQDAAEFICRHTTVWSLTCIRKAHA